MKIRSKVKNSLKKIGKNIFSFSSDRESNQEINPYDNALSDFKPAEISLIQNVIDYTMTSQERIYALIQAVRYISRNNIAGDIIECGVWKGGSMMAVALTLNQLGDTNRHLYLCDTFEGMTEPAEIDKDFKGNDALATYKSSINSDRISSWCYASIESVKEVMYKTGYDRNKIHFIKGKVEDTIPTAAPRKISLLRLDTDWYESTRHELIHLFPRLSVGGVIIIDDYGYWQGSRMAVDEYFEQNNIKILLNRIDNAGRMGVKL